MENEKSQTYSNEEQAKPTTSFLRRAMTLTELPQTPQDLPAMQIWFFTRCQSRDQAFNLLRIYQTLLIDLDFTPREIEGWLAQSHLGRNIPGAALQEDVPVFKFSDEDEEFLGQFDAPPEWAGMRTLEIESAMEWELEIVRSLARVRAVTEPKGFLEKWLLGPEEEEEEEYPLTCERRLEPDNWRKLYSSWEWRQKIADMWYRSPPTEQSAGASTDSTVVFLSLTPDLPRVIPAV
ncbi:hypothetical protein BDP67DRAFT_583922 [Colletotrichum lupini]|nr:hypothetical protein BDP67DRAFT_583922 [Colletotrichum lupini]